MKRSTRAVAVVAGTLVSLSVAVAGAGSASATTIGTGEGCTPGYWKNHASNWQASPTGLVDRAFPSADLYESPRTTWLQALQGGGGPGAKGAATILLRAATAASLNAAYDPLQYPLARVARPGYTGVLVFPATEAALASGDRQRMLDLAAYFDGLNNADCPLS